MLENLVKNKKAVLALVFVFFLPINYVNAEKLNCSSNGYTILTMNGVFTEEEDAKKNRDSLNRQLPRVYEKEPLTVDYLHNETHLAGLGDLFKVAKQGLLDEEGVIDYDLREMLKDASEKVKTQKLLIVAHSQGNFYANSFYDSVANKEGGVPSESIGVYSIATPSGHVAGGGKWLTSDTDKVIAGVVGRTLGRKIMPTNTHIELGAGDDSLGHNLGNVYLKYKGAQIVSDIQESLSKLQANNVQANMEGCINPPKLSFLHKTEKVLFAVADPVAEVSRDTVVVSATGVSKLGNFVAKATSKTLASIGHATMKVAEVTAKGIYKTGEMVTSVASNTADIAVQAGSNMTKQVASVFGIDSGNKNNTTEQKTETNSLSSNIVSASEALDSVSDLDLSPATTADEFSPENNLVIEESVIDNTDENTPVVLVNEEAQNLESEIVALPEAESSLVKEEVKSEESNQTVQVSPEVSSPVFFSAPAGFGGVGGGAPIDKVAPSAPAINSPSNNAALSNSTVSFSGIAESLSVVSIDSLSKSVTADSEGNWGISYTFTDGSHSVDIFATDSAGNKSSASSIGFSVDTSSPDSPTVSSPATSTPLSSSSVTFSGTAEVGSTLSIDGISTTTIANSDGSWDISSTFADGSHSVDIFATDSAGNKSATTTISFSVDTSLPDISLNVSECDNSISTSGCLIPVTSSSVTWSSSDSNLSYFILDIGGTVSVTSATSTTANFTDGADTSISISAVDTAGNKSATTTQEVSVNTLPVAINEIAWMGTTASSVDEWIELYNNTNKEISLSNFVLYTETLDPYIPLSGTISASGYYLLERKNTGDIDESAQSPVKDVTASLWESFSSGLNNGGENVYLVRSVNNSTTTIDYVSECSGNWCKGDNSGKKTMERISSTVAGNISSNWGTSLGEDILNGKDTGDNPIKGTPGKRNSVSYLISQSSSISENLTLTKNNSPYFIRYNDDLVINSGYTLTIEPGVVIKISPTNGGGKIKIKGGLIANGTSSEKISFTSLFDDTLGGDMNSDGSATSPSYGDWKQIFIDDTNASTTLAYVDIKYGGKSSNGALGIEKGSGTISNTTVSYSDDDGIYVKNTNNVSITNSTFSYNNQYGNSAGVYLLDSSVTVNNNTFDTNGYGMYISGDNTSTITNNVINNSSSYAVLGLAVPANIKGNTGSGNVYNAINIGGNLLENATTTLGANGLSYLLDYDLRVKKNSVLAFESGVVIKGTIDTGNTGGRIVVEKDGTVFHDGSTASDVYFTSIHDDTVGSTVDSATTSPNGGDWMGFSVEKEANIIMSGFTVRYGGAKKNLSGDDKGGIVFLDTPSTATIQNALFEKNARFGIRFKGNGHLDISNSTISNNSAEYDSKGGISLEGATATMSNMTFSNNVMDIKGNSSGTVTCTNCGTPSTEPADLIAE